MAIRTLGNQRRPNALVHCPKYFRVATRITLPQGSKITMDIGSSNAVALKISLTKHDSVNILRATESLAQVI